MSANQAYSTWKRLTCILCISLTLQNCVGMIAGTAVDTTIEVVKVPFKVPFKLAGAAIDLAIPDDKDDEDDEE